MQYGKLSHLHTDYDFKSVEEYTLWVKLAHHASESQLNYLMELAVPNIGVELVGFQAYLDLTASAVKCKVFIQKVLDNENICIGEKPPKYGDGQTLVYIDIDDFFNIVSDALAAKAHNISATREIESNSVVLDAYSL